MGAQLAPPGAALAPAKQPLTTQMVFTKRPDNTAEPMRVDLRPGGPGIRDFPKDAVNIRISDMRDLQQQPQLHVNGFELVPCQAPEGIDWTNSSQVKNLYYSAVTDLLKKHTGAKRVHIFDHTVRRGALQGGQEDVDAEQTPDKQGFRPPAPTAHVDYTEVSGRSRLHDLLPDEADELSKSPFAIIQVWQSLLKTPVLSSPLDFVDAQSTEPADFHPVEITFPHRIGRVQAVLHNPAQAWFYASRMEPGEAYIWVGYDSRPGNASFIPHGSFKDPSAPSDAPPRESVETRAYCFF